VWPIPGGRYDPQRLGRIVLISLGALALLALVLFTMRLRDTGEQRRAAVERQEQETPAVEETEPAGEVPAETVLISEDVIGADATEAEQVLSEGGLEVSTEPVSSEEYPEGAVVDTSPPVGTELSQGDAITLLVSTGPSDEEDDDDEEEDETGPPKHSKGKGPKKEKDD
jgi:hypothetical protein